MRYKRFLVTVLVVAFVWDYFVLDAHAARGRRVEIDMDNWNDRISIDIGDVDVSNEIVVANNVNAETPSNLPMKLNIGTSTLIDRIWIDENGFISLGASANDTPTPFDPSASSVQSFAADLIAVFYTDLEPDICIPNNPCGELIYETCFPGVSCFDKFGRAIKITWGADSSNQGTRGLLQAGSGVNLILAQLLILDKSSDANRATGDFDLQFAYNDILWEGLADNSAPTVVGFRLGNSTLDFADFYASFQGINDEDSPNDQCIGVTPIDPIFSPTEVFPCNIVNIQFRNGIPTLESYTGDLSISDLPAIEANSTEEFSVIFSAENTSQNGTTTGVTTTIEIPPEFEFVSSSSCVEDTSFARCDLGVIDSGSSADYSVSLSSNSATNAVLTTTVMGDQYDPNLGSNTAQIDVTILPSADLAVMNCATDLASYDAGASGTFSCSITNNGPQTATTVQLVATLPNFVAFSSGAACLPTGNTVACDIFGIDSGSAQPVSFVFNANSPGSMRVPSLVSATEYDPSIANNEDPGPSINVNTPAVIEPEIRRDGGGAVSLILTCLIGAVFLTRRLRLLTKQQLNKWWPGAESNHRHADFQFGG